MRKLTVIGLEEIRVLNSTVNKDDIETEAGRNECVDESNRRGTVLMVTCFIALGVGLNLFTLSSTSQNVAERLSLNETGVEMLTTMPFLIHALLGFIVLCFIENHGLNAAFFTNVLFQFLGGLSTYIGLIQKEPENCLGLVIFGQLFNGTAFALCLELMVKTANFWSGDETMLVYGSLFTSLYFGTFLKSMVLGFPTGLGSVEKIQNIALSRAIIAAVVGVIYWVCIRKKLQPPCCFHQATTKRQIPKYGTLSWNSLLAELQFSCMNINLLLLRQANSIYLALANTTLLLLCTVIKNEFPHLQLTSHWVEASTSLSGIIGIFCGVGLAKIKNKNKILTCAFVSLSASLMAMFTFAAKDSKSFPLSVLFIALWGVAGFALLGFGLEKVNESSHRTSVNVVPTLCMTTASFYIVILFMVARWAMKTFGLTFVGYFFTSLYGLCLLLVLVSRNRSDCVVYKSFQDGGLFAEC